MKVWMKRVTALVLAAGMTLALTGCAGKKEDLMEKVEPRPATDDLPLEHWEPSVPADFALSLLRQCSAPGEDALVSPLSVLTALAMTANGAEGETRAQMSAVLGAEPEALNPALRDWMAVQEGQLLHMANSIWFAKDKSFTADPEFLQTNRDFYGAELYAAPFDGSTVREINRWVKKNTHDMIPEIVKELSPESVMCLVNALAFEGKWIDPYEERQVWEGPFYPADSAERQVEFLHSREYRYLENESCTGYMKGYDGNYDFVALLPREGMTAEELAAALDGEQLVRLLQNPENVPVDTAVPRFKTEFEGSLSQALKEMGMPLAFTEGADFSGLGAAEGPIYIGDVLHRTFLELGEKGTRAGAATAVIMEATGCEPEKEEEPKSVILDRPFLYMIVDRACRLPVFLGILADPVQ